MKKTKNVFITGAEGFIGRNLKEYWQNKFNVFAPSHQELDLTDARQTREYIIGHDINVIAHCAAYGAYQETIATIQDIVSSNLKMFFNIAHCLDKAQKMIYLGSGAEYGRDKPIIKAKEEDFDQIIPEDNYGFYKYICSKYIEKSRQIVCLRLFGVYGKYAEDKFISDAIIKNILKQDIVINQNVFFDFLFVDDLMPIIDYFAACDVRFKIYNVAFGEPIDLVSISEIINNVSDFQSKIIVLKEGLNNSYTADNSRLKKEIPNFIFTDYQKAIKKLLTYYQNELRKKN